VLHLRRDSDSAYTAHLRLRHGPRPSPPPPRPAARRLPQRPPPPTHHRRESEAGGGTDGPALAVPPPRPTPTRPSSGATATLLGGLPVHIAMLHQLLFVVVLIDPWRIYLRNSFVQISCICVRVVLFINLGLILETFLSLYVYREI
jgi:hypothetical protein